MFIARPPRWIAVVTASALIGTSVPSPLLAAGEVEVPAAALVGLRTGEAGLDLKAREGLTEGFERTGRLGLVSEQETARRVAAVWAGDRGEAAASVERAYKDFLEGKRLYGRLALEEAIASLSASVRGYREGIAALRDNRFLLLSHLYLGIALIILGRETEGRKYIREMVVLDPSRKSQKLSPREFSPKILGIHKALTDEVLRGPTGTVVVESRPPGVKVIFDGVVQKAAPLEIAGVPVGEHFMVAELDGYRSFSRRVVVGAGENLVNVVLTEWQPFSPYSQARRADLASLDLLGQTAEKLGARILVLARAEPAEEGEVLLTAQLFDARTRRFSGIESARMPSAKMGQASGGLAERLARSLARDGSVLPESSVPASPTERFDDKPPVAAIEEPSRSERKPITRQWWFWTALAVVVAGAGVGTYLALRPDADYTVLNVDNPLVP